MGGVSEGAFRVDQNGGENGRPTGLFRGFFLSSTPNSRNFLSFYLIFNFGYGGLCVKIVLFLFFFKKKKVFMYLACFIQVLFQLQTMVAFRVSEQR